MILRVVLLSVPFYLSSGPGMSQPIDPPIPHLGPNVNPPPPCGSFPEVFDKVLLYSAACDACKFEGYMLGKKYTSYHAYRQTSDTTVFFAGVRKMCVLKDHWVDCYHCTDPSAPQ